ncbi:hypothetical protein SHI21_16315 [Bacteriovorax sp. PP10]|uniref:Lipoprotein n=1 Tax=Bacteriovorax antarcticus TaxID=3088717 RepID=A0ABU5VYZ1_9BACT|nr:hypothetical protein [Bacteriovorax sp. PP10]MEA9357797.1 hypothetical protein [Bacteriovorax sp. PP10]
MKKLFIISIILITIISLTACGKKADTTGSGNTFSLKGSGS